MSDRPRLLFLCQTLPFPPDGGVHIRTFHVIRLLARTFDMTALCFYRKAERPGPADVEASIEGLKPYARVEAFAIPQEHDPLRLIWDHARSLLDGRAYTWHAYDSTEMRERLRVLLETESFDLVHMDSLDLACYLPMVRHLPVVCAHHNVESALLRRRALAERGRARRWYLARQAELTERMEREWCGRVALNASVSPIDRIALKKLAPSASVVAIPNGVDVDQFRPHPGAGDGIISVGGINWFPNRDALAFFSGEILPIIRESMPRTEMHWVGRASEAERSDYHRKHAVTLTGYVDDVRGLVRNAACFVVPLRVGGGTRLKILDAWAMGKAVVSTSVGCEGLAAVDGENILIRDTARGFATAVTRVLRDESFRNRLGAAGRETAENIYSWEVIGRAMLETYDLVRQSPAALEEAAA